MLLERSTTIGIIIQRNNAEKEYVNWMEMNLRFPPNLASVSDVVDHIDHIVKVAGIDHVGIGTDFDEVAVLPTASILHKWDYYLRIGKRGYSEEEIRKIWGGNFMRVFRAVEQIAQQG